MASLLLALVLAAPSQHAIVWGEGDTRETNRAIEQWFAARDRGTLPPIELRPGFPKNIAAPGEHADPRVELVILGICDRDAARRVVRALRSANPAVRILELRNSAVRRACPKLATRRATSVMELLDQLAPKRAAAAERERSRVALCSFDRAGRVARYGPDYLCGGLWGLSCAEYAETMALAELPPGDPCAFLLARTDAATILRVDLARVSLTICDAENAAYAFAQPKGSALHNPVEILCGHGPGYATRLGRMEAVGDGVCIEYARVFGKEGLNAGLVCYAATDAPPYAIVDALRLMDDRGPGRYGVSHLDGERILCTNQTAFQLNPRGLAPIKPWPRACDGIPLRLPLPEIRP